MDPVDPAELSSQVSVGPREHHAAADGPPRAIFSCWLLYPSTKRWLVFGLLGSDPRLIPTRTAWRQERDQKKKDKEKEKKNAKTRPGGVWARMLCWCCHVLSFHNFWDVFMMNPVKRLQVEWRKIVRRRPQGSGSLWLSPGLARNKHGYRFVIYIEAWWQCSTHNRCPPETHVVFFLFPALVTPHLLGIVKWLNPSPLDWHPGLLDDPGCQGQVEEQEGQEKVTLSGCCFSRTFCVRDFFCNMSKPKLQTFQTWEPKKQHQFSGPSRGGRKGYGLVLLEQKIDTRHYNMQLCQTSHDFSIRFDSFSSKHGHFTNVGWDPSTEPHAETRENGKTTWMRMWKGCWANGGHDMRCDPTLAR